jgi:outer membrane protein OmpA-like peptidoglycan-associated protein
MKLRLTHRYRTLLTCITLVLTAAVSGCSTAYPPERRWDGCGLIGGVVGTGLGAAAGYGVEELNKPHPNTGDLAAGIGGGAAIGGIMGAVIGHEICDPLIPPPPPPPPPAPVVVMPPPPPPPEVRHEKLVLRGVHFDFNKSKIRPGDAAILDEAAQILKSHPDVNVYDDGYCDAIGSEEYNLKLSQRRADAVARYLEDQGIPESRLIPRGFGKTGFVAPNDTDEGRAQNRRVELKPTE